VATAKKDKGRGDATAPLVVSAPGAHRGDRVRGQGKGGGRDQNQGQAEGKAKGGGRGQSNGQGQDGAGGDQNSAGGEGQNGRGQSQNGGGRGSSSGSSGKTTTTPSPVAIPATATPAPAPAATPAPAVPSTPAATSTPAAAPTPVSRPVADMRAKVRTVQGRRGAGGASGGRTAAGSDAGGGFAAAAVAPAGGGAASAAASTAARRAPVQSPRRALARQSTDGSPVARTAERIVSVIPWPMWALIGVLAALSLALGAHSWIGDRQRRRLRDDVGLLQSALLPTLPGVLGAVATSAAYRPADGPGAGGDFYDMFELGDGRLGVVVGDLSGHGREVLPQTALVRYTLRAYLEAGLAPRTALQTAAGVLDHQLEVAFATVALATYDPRGRTLTYALAGHPPPIVLGSDGPVRAVTAA